MSHNPFALGRSESPLRNVESGLCHYPETLPGDTGVSEDWLLSDPPTDAGILDTNGTPGDPLQLLDPLVLGDYDFRNALPMSPTWSCDSRWP